MDTCSRALHVEVGRVHREDVWRCFLGCRTAQDRDLCLTFARRVRALVRRVLIVVAILFEAVDYVWETLWRRGPRCLWAIHTLGHIREVHFFPWWLGFSNIAFSPKCFPLPWLPAVSIACLLFTLSSKVSCKHCSPSTSSDKHQDTTNYYCYPRERVPRHNERANGHRHPNASPPLQRPL